MDPIEYKIKRPQEGFIEISAIISGSDVAELIHEAHEALASGVGIDIEGRSTDELRLELVSANHYTEEEFAEMLRTYVYGRSLAAIMQAVNEEIIGDPMLDCHEEPVAGKELAMRVGAVLKPQLKLSSYEPVTLEVPDTTITEADIDEQVAGFMEQQAAYVPSEKRRGLQMGDYAYIAVKMFHDGAEVEQLSSEKSLLHVSYDQMPQGFIDGIIGTEPGKQIEFDFEGPDMGARTPEATTSYHAQVQVITLLNRMDHDLTDEWLKENSPYESVEVMRKAIRSNLELQVTSQLEEYKQAAVDQAIMERLEGTIPDAVYEYVMHQMDEAFEEEMQAQGITRQQYFAQEGITEEQYNAGTMVEIQSLLRRNLALDALFKGRRMKITEPDIMAALREMLPGEGPEVREELEATGQIHMVREEAARRKARQWLVDTAILKVVDAPSR